MQQLLGNQIVVICYKLYMILRCCMSEIQATCWLFSSTKVLQKMFFIFFFLFFFCLCWLKLIVKVFSSMKSNITLGDVKVMRPIFTETTSSNLIMHFLLHYLLILIIYCYKHHWNNMQKQVCDLYFPTT